MPLLYTLLLLVGVAIIFVILTQVKIKDGLTLVFSFWFNLILPGYCILLKFDFDSLERVLLGIPVSAALLSMLLYGINIFWMKVSLLNITLIVLLITGVGILLKVREVKK